MLLGLNATKNSQSFSYESVPHVKYTKYEKMYMEGYICVPNTCKLILLDPVYSISLHHGLASRCQPEHCLRNPNPGFNSFKPIFLPSPPPILLTLSPHSIPQFTLFLNPFHLCRAHFTPVLFSHFTPQPCPLHPNHVFPALAVSMLSFINHYIYFY